MENKEQLKKVIEILNKAITSCEGKMSIRRIDNQGFETTIVGSQSDILALFFELSVDIIKETNITVDELKFLLELTGSATNEEI